MQPAAPLIPFDAKGQIIEERTTHRPRPGCRPYCQAKTFFRTGRALICLELFPNCKQNTLSAHADWCSPTIDSGSTVKSVRIPRIGHGMLWCASQGAPRRTTRFPSDSRRGIRLPRRQNVSLVGRPRGSLLRKWHDFADSRGTIRLGGGNIAYDHGRLQPDRLCQVIPNSPTGR